MTYANLTQQGVTYGKLRAKATEVEAAYRLLATAKRWESLHWAMVARVSNLRAAHRRYLRKRGMPLAPLAATSKYRTKGRRAA